MTRACIFFTLIEQPDPTDNTIEMLPLLLSQLTEFEHNATESLSMVTEKQVKLDAAVQDLASFFGEDVKKFNAKEFLTYIEEFVTNLKKAADDNKIARDRQIAKIKKERKEQAKKGAEGGR